MTSKQLFQNSPKQPSLGRVAVVAFYSNCIGLYRHGYLPIYMNTALYLKMFFFGFGVYLVVLLFEMQRIRKVPMDAALKAME